MLSFIEGNLLKSSADALVNTVNEVGVMGKGIALMFRDMFPANNLAYERACKAGAVRVGHIFVVENEREWGPRWIVNFPTKKHWRNPSQITWVEDGLVDLREWIITSGVRSIAVPPLGCGNGGLDWAEVKKLITSSLGSLDNVAVEVYEPTIKYQNVPKAQSVRHLTPSRAMVAEMVRQYGVLGFDCSMLEVQKLAWFLQRGLEITRLDNPLKLKFEAGRFGPYADNLRHLLEGLDGSFLHSAKRIADASRHDIVTFDETREQELSMFLSQAKMSKYADALAWAHHLIEGFESPFGMELLATIDWLVSKAAVSPTLEAVKTAIASWPHSESSAQRKAILFDDRVLQIALARLVNSYAFEGSQRGLSLSSHTA